MEIFGSIIIGIIAGAIISRVTWANSFEACLYIFFGMLGSVLGGWICTLTGEAFYSIWTVLLFSVIGALLFLRIATFIKNKLQ